MLKSLIANKEVLNIYLYGSRVYGTATTNSDYDFVVVVSNSFKYSTDILEYNNEQYNFYSIDEWEDMNRKNHIVALECAYLGSEYIIKEEQRINIELDIILLRQSISSVSSNAYVKCRKKLEVEKDFNPYIAKKSLWHSIRILLYGIQLVEYRKILDYSVANKYYQGIVQNNENNWVYYKEVYGEFYNELRSEFRAKTSREWQEWKRQSL